MKKKNALIVLLLIFNFTKIVGQTLTNEEIASLKEFNTSLLNKEKELHDSKINRILLNAGYLERNKRFVSVLTKNVDNNLKLSKVAELINPSSTALTGKSYNDYIRESAKQMLVDTISNPADRTRFNTILNNLTSSNNNPKIKFVGSLIETALSFTPVAGLVNGIISSASAWFSTVVSGSNNKIQNIQQTFTADKLKSFYEGMKVYTEFYDQALDENQKLKKDLESAKFESLHLQTEFNLSQKDFIASLTNSGITLQNISYPTLASKFPFNINRSLNPSSDTHFESLNGHVKKLDSLVILQDQLYTRVERLVGTYLTNIENLALKFNDKAPALKNLEKLAYQTQVAGVSLGATINSNSDVTTLKSSLLPLASSLNITRINEFASSDIGIPNVSITPKSNNSIASQLDKLDEKTSLAAYKKLNIDYYTIKLSH